MRRQHALLFAAVAAGSVGCDHATKQIAQAALEGRGAVPLAAGTLRFELTANPGTFLSLGAGVPDEIRQPLLLIGLPLLLAAVCVLLLRSGATSRRELMGIALFAGGGLANWLDRVLHGGAVTDFVSFGIGPLRTGIFNLADVIIVLGIGLFLLPRRAPPAAAP